MSDDDSWGSGDERFFFFFLFSSLLFSSLLFSSLLFSSLLFSSLLFSSLLFSLVFFGLNDCYFPIFLTFSLSLPLFLSLSLSLSLPFNLPLSSDDGDNRQKQNLFKQRMAANVSSMKEERCASCDKVTDMGNQLKIEGVVYHKNVCLYDIS